MPGWQVARMSLGGFKNHLAAEDTAGSKILLPDISCTLDTANFATSYFLKLKLELETRPRTKPYKIHMLSRCCTHLELTWGSCSFLTVGTHVLSRWCPHLELTRGLHCFLTEGTHMLSRWCTHLELTQGSHSFLTVGTHMLRRFHTHLELTQGSHCFLTEGTHMC